MADLVPPAGPAPLAGVENANPDDVNAALGFFLLGNIGQGVRASAWTIEKEISILTEIAANEEGNPRIRMEAMRDLRRILKEAADMSGYVSQIEVRRNRTTEGGTESAELTATRVLRQPIDTLPGPDPEKKATALRNPNLKET